MQAVASELIVLLKKLQSFESLRSFSLGGGTNLALRYHHRKSDDIDLFTDQIIGKEGFEKIRIELEINLETIYLDFNIHAMKMINSYLQDASLKRETKISRSKFFKI